VPVDSKYWTTVSEITVSSTFKLVKKPLAFLSLGLVYKKSAVRSVATTEKSTVVAHLPIISMPVFFSA